LRRNRAPGISGAVSWSTAGDRWCGVAEIDEWAEVEEEAGTPCRTNAVLPMMAAWGTA